MNIDIQAISKSYRKKPVLKDITLSTCGGKCVGILGSNGTGKSTLLSILAGIQACDSGAFLCDGKDLFQQPRLRSKLVGYVPQGTPLFDELNAWDNLTLWYDTKTLKRELESGLLAMLVISNFIKTPV